MHIWVVNNVGGGKDGVYKYAAPGECQARWNIDPANAKPTGIRIDPTGASDAIWTVDSVYQYNGDTTRTNGSAVADAVFALAATNTNPQGIAHPLPNGIVPSPLRSATDLGNISSWPAAVWTEREAPRRIRDSVIRSITDGVLGEDMHILGNIELPPGLPASPSAIRQYVDRPESVGAADDASEFDKVFGDFDAELIGGKLIDLIVESSVHNDAH